MTASYQMSETTEYISRHLPMLTDGQQHPEVEQNFLSDLLTGTLSGHCETP